MIDRWFYTHAGQTLGPVTATQLRELAASGRLAPNDLIWPEGRQQSDGVPAQAAVEFTEAVASRSPLPLPPVLSPPPPPPLLLPPPPPPLTSPPPPPLQNKPDWLDDIRANSPPSSPASRGGMKGGAAPPSPEWLEDVRAAEAEQQEFLTLEWDGDNANVEEEAAKQILDELEGAPESETKMKAVATTPTCRLVIGSASSRGRVRDRNEDSLLVQQFTWCNLDQRHDAALIVVADGMGGHQAGDRASRVVIRAFANVLTPLLTATLSEQTQQTAPAEPSSVVEGGLREANRLVRETSMRDPAWRGMGSTAVALLIWDGQAHIGLVGDCRVYHWRGGKLTQVTRDQTLVARMVELGQLSPQEAAKHPRRTEVAQAVGKYALIEPSHYDLSLNAGDWLITCSDGLQSHVNDRALGDSISKAGSSAAELAHRLVEMANQGGGSDNCTVVVVRCM